jgi:hypothetical protein
MERALQYVLPGESVDDPTKTLEDWIKRAERRGDEEFKIQTGDGFTVYERYYKHNPDGTKKLISKNYLKEDELTPKEAVEAMLNNKRLIDYKHFPDEALYRWNGEHFIVYDCYTYQSKILKSFTGLHRYTPDKGKEQEREKIRVREVLGFDLDLSDLKMVNRQYGLKGAMLQAISMCKAQNWDITEAHVYSVLANLDSDLEGMFS